MFASQCWKANHRGEQRPRERACLRGASLPGGVRLLVQLVLLGAGGKHSKRADSPFRPRSDSDVLTRGCLLWCPRKWHSEASEWQCSVAACGACGVGPEVSRCVTRPLALQYDVSTGGAGGLGRWAGS